MMYDDEIRKLIEYHAKILAAHATNNFTAPKGYLRTRVQRIAELVEKLEDSE